MSSLTLIKDKADLLWSLLFKRRFDLAWAGSAAVARLAPLCALPLLVRLSEPEDADWFALVQADAAVLAVVFGLAQAQVVQANHGIDGRSGVASVAVLIPVFAAGILSALCSMAYPFDRRTIASICFGLCIAYVPIIQAFARTERQYVKSAALDVGRFLILSLGLCASILIGGFRATSMLVALGFFYLFPLPFWVKVRLSDYKSKSTYSLWARTVPSMLFLTASNFAGIFAWMKIRYSIEAHLPTGALAGFSATLGVASVMTLLVDLAIFRISQRVIGHARLRDGQVIRQLGYRFAATSLWMAIGSLALVWAYASLQFEASVMVHGVLGTLFVLGYLLRAAYVYFQHILLAVSRTHIDLLASSVMLASAYLFVDPLISSMGLLGGGIAFFGLAALNLSVVAAGCARIWRPR